MPQIENENDPKAGGLRDEQILAIDIVIMSTLSMLGSLFMILASLRTMFGKRLRNKWLQWSTVLTSNRHSSAEGIEEEDHTLSDSGRSRYHGSGPTRASNNRMVLSLALINLFMSGMYIYSQILYIWLPDGGYIEGDTTSVAICTSQAYLVLSAQWVHMTWQLLFGFNFALRVNTPYLGIRAAKFILQHYVALEIIYHVIAWGVSLSISTILLLTDGLGRTFFGCWIKKGLFAQFFLYYIPQFVFYGLIFIFYLVTVVVVKHLQTKSRLMSWLPSRIVKEKSSSARNILSVKRILRQSRAIFKLNAHLLMYILATAPTLIISIINFIIPDFAPLWLMLLKTSFCLSGFFDSIVFSINNGYISVSCTNKRTRQRDTEDQSLHTLSSFVIDPTSSIQYVDFESHIAESVEDVDTELHDEDSGDDGDLHEDNQVHDRNVELR